MSEGAPSRVDCHVKILNEQVIERAKRAGLDAIVYAPHFTRLPDIREQAARYSSEELLVVPGREVFTGPWHDRKHILAIGLTDPVPDFIPLEATIAEFERQAATVLVPHPEFATVGLTEAHLRQYRETIDAVEVFNPKHLPWNNERARTLATELEIPPFTSSYAHLTGTVGICHTRFDTSVDTAADLRDALEDGIPRRIVHETGFEHARTTATELAHLAYENCWKKTDRFFLSGLEPTHPRHIAYDGRFDDVAVY
ncbi:PHP domain-containing protein [Salinadaptatus halalkaliphilus]|uniref:PHP domain-containing protein n=1 Tax=Salinadaptatus halalkaliphilus TaxID=2419781 RepID=A0A4S3TIH5_9EURY|nr:PHP-associated domain-containing protein [Salinadaptatus halalkaliphilus]THE63746.1 PHP domain-containing protein [Salinadaptatus halalkaliphilus]